MYLRRVLKSILSFFTVIVVKMEVANNSLYEFHLFFFSTAQSRGGGGDGGGGRSGSRDLTFDILKTQVIV